MMSFSKLPNYSMIANMRRLFAFCCVGGLCFLLSMALMVVQVEIIRLNYLAATGITWVLGNVLGFVLNKRITFRTPGHKWKTEIVRYFLVMGTSFSVSMAFMYLAVTVLGFHYLLSSIALAGFMLMINYLLHSIWSFKGTCIDIDDITADIVPLSKE